MMAFMKDFTSPLGRKKLVVITLILLAITGVILIGYITDVGPWAYSDSAAYLTTAKNIIAGRGIVLQDMAGNYSLIPLHAPLYPLAVSVPMLFGVNAVQSSRWINAVLFGLTLFIAGWATWRFTRSFWLTVTAAVLILGSYEPIYAFSGAMSEGLFIFPAFLSLFFLATGMEGSHRKKSFYLLSGFFIGLAILARYVGLALIPAAIITIFIGSRENLRGRLRQSALVLAPAAVLAATWFIPVFLTSRTFGGRPIAGLVDIVKKTSNYFSSFYRVVISWLPFVNRGNRYISPNGKIILFLILATIIIFAAVIILKRQKQSFNQNGILTWILALVSFIGCYVVLHLASYITALTQPDVDGRLLLPVFIAGILLGCGLAAFVGQAFKPNWVPGVVFLLLALTTLWYFHGKLYTFVFDMHHYGMGYTSRRWNEEIIFSRIKEIDPHAKLASNDAGLVLFYTERFPEQIVLDKVARIYHFENLDQRYLILFNYVGKYDLDNTYESEVAELRNNYSVYFEDKTGIILMPR